MGGCENMEKSFGFPGRAFDQVVVFQSSEMLLAVLATNPNMEPIIGAGQEMDEDFPGVYIAGVTARRQPDNTEAGHKATQK